MRLQNAFTAVKGMRDDSNRVADRGRAPLSAAEPVRN